MSNHENAQTTEPVAIIRQVSTIAITFVDKPTDQRRRELKDAGYRFENGQWYKSHSQGQNADDSLVAQVIAA
jgi:hypothetical protein